MSRTRYKDFYIGRGYYGSYTGVDIIDTYHYSVDELGKSRDHDLYLEHFHMEHPRFNGITLQGDVVTDFVGDNMFWRYHDTVINPDPDSEMVTAQAHTNPNRPVVDLPLALYELRELPAMIQEVGNKLIALARSKGRPPSIRDTIHITAKGNLEVQFGWLPLFSDISKILQFHDHADRRFKELARLNSKHGLRRRNGLTRKTAITEPYDFIFQGGGFQAIGSLDWIEYTTSWAVIQWRLKEGIRLPMSSDRLYALAVASIGGLTPDLNNIAVGGLSLETIWNGIPFSWLVDYFGNIGDVLAAGRGGIPVEASEGLWMCRQFLTGRVTNMRITGQPLVWNGAGFLTFERKRRKVYTGPLPTGFSSVHFLNGQQWSILGSLAVGALLK